MPLSFISLDGLDGTGKSTQCRLLAEWFRQQGRAVTECRDPGGTPLGTAIRELVLHQRHAMTPMCEAFLFMASRSQLVAEVIQPALARGQAVVCDRFLLANVVYQGHAGGLDPATLWEIGQLATGGLEPDLTLILDLPVEAALARRQGTGDRFESRDFAYHARVRAGFLSEASRRPECLLLIDATGSIEQVHERIVTEVKRVLSASPRT
jgi:dTMP kinase